MDLHRAVISLVVALQHLSPTQIARILHLLMFDTDQFHLSQVSQLVQHASPTQFRYLVAASVSLTPTPLAPEEHAQQLEFLGQLSSVQFTSFGIVFQLCRLQEIFHQHFSGSCDQLFKVLEVIPNATPDKQLELLQMLQLLLIDVTPNNMIELQEETQHNNTSVAILLNIQPHNPMALVCEPMRSLLTVPQADLLAIQRALVVLDPYQLALLVQLKQIDPFEIMELSQLLSPNHRIGALGLQVDSIDEEITLSLRIIDQPPEKSVYKRNLKPNPTVHVAGRPTQLEPEDQLYLVPKLVRCDTQVEVPDRLSGDTPIEVVAGSITAFRRIKVLITSHQMDETLFAIRFELQRYKRGEFCDVICFVQSNPMAIVSHSTLMKTPSPVAPVIFEICPSYGNFHGETRVAIIGQNFVESPTARVKVAESYIVEPRFHDTGTLICTIPKHICSGEVEIRVSNDSTRWSETSTKFLYIDPAVNSF